MLFFFVYKSKGSHDKDQPLCSAIKPVMCTASLSRSETCLPQELPGDSGARGQLQRQEVGGERGQAQAEVAQRQPLLLAHRPTQNVRASHSLLVESRHGYTTKRTLLLIVKWS